MLALGVLQGLKESGRGVPDDIALIGFDGIRAGTLADPALTTLEPDLDAAGEALVAMAIEDTGYSRSGTRIPVRLVARGSACRSIVSAVKRLPSTNRYPPPPMVPTGSPGHPLRGQQ